MRFNRKSFFDGYRKRFGPIEQLQVDGLNFLLDKIERDPEWKSVPQVAYFLSTIKHETEVERGGVLQAFQPIKELRERQGSPRRANQDRYWKSGHYGRGFVQITWPNNYAKFGIKDDPDRALDPDVAYDIAARGMRKGMFTGKNLSDFINGKTDYFNARTIVNGHDKAMKIADEAVALQVLLEDAVEAENGIVTGDAEDKGEEQKVEAPAATQTEPKPEVLPVEAPKGSIITKIAAAASAAGPVIGATGLKIGGVEFKTGGLIAFAAVVIVGMIIGAILYNEDRKRAFERQKMSIDNLADKDRRNVIAAGSKV